MTIQKYNGRILKVYCRKEKLPNNHVMDLEYTKHPGAVLIVPFVNKGEVLIINQYRPVIRKTIYEFPAGIIESGEKLKDTALRELEEETGFRAGSMKKIGQLITTPGYSTEKITVFCARDLKKTNTKLDAAEIISQRIVKVRDLKQMVRTGKITDSKTLAAMALAGLLK